MVVRTDEAIGSAFLGARRWHKGVTGKLTGRTRLSPARTALVNARAAALSATGARLHRETVECFLATHAAAGEHRRG